MVLRCDSCGETAPDVVGPILFAFHHWGEFGIDGEHEGRAWRADVLLCPRHAVEMDAYVKAGGTPRAGRAPAIATCRGGLGTEPRWLDVVTNRVEVSTATPSGEAPSPRKDSQ